MSARGRNHPASAAQCSTSGFVVSTLFLVIMTLVLVIVFVGLVALRNALLTKAETNVIRDSASPANIIGKPIDYGICEEPQILCPDTGLSLPPAAIEPGPTEGLFALLGVRPDRFVSRDRIYYTGADCTIPAGETAHIAPPAVPPFTPPELSVGYLNALESVSYGVGAPRTWPADTTTFGPGLLYRAGSTTAASQVIRSVWASLAPDCPGFAIAFGSGTAGEICQNFPSGLSLELLPAVEVVDSTGNNLLETYTPPFTIAPATLGEAPPTPEGAVVIPPDPTAPATPEDN